jgi:hypothetical protein
MAKKLPDDNDLHRAGRLFGYFDGVEPGDPANDSDAAPAPPQVPPLLSPGEASALLLAALGSPLPLVVIRSTPGAGKSASTRLVLRDHVEAGGRAVVVVPTHKLAGQTVEALGALQVDATAPRSAARVRLPLVNDGPTDARACLHAEAADLLAQAGAPVRRTLCTVCPAREAYPTTGGPCPAYQAGTDRAPVQVLQQPTLAAVLGDLTAKLCEGKDGVATLAIIDELPPLTTSVALAKARDHYRALAGELRAEVREHLEPLLLAVLDGAAKASDGASVRELAALGGRDAAYIDGALADARALDGAALWRPDLHKRMARFAVTHAGDDAVLTKLRALARITSLCEAIVDAAHNPDEPALWVDETTGARLEVAARWTRRVLPFVQAGGRLRLLDATAPEQALRARWGSAVEVVRIDVADAPGVERRFVVWQHGARSRHTHADGTPNAAQVRGPLRRIAAAALERHARSVAILTHKPLADALRAWLDAPPDAPTPAFVPVELAALVASGVELRVGHYGAQRGLDTWADCDVVATLGDPWPNLGAALAAARALGLDPSGWPVEVAMAELIQAWGRARTVHRTTPVLVLHQGSKALAPRLDTAPQWADVAASKVRRGAPSTVQPPSDPSSWADEREGLGLSAKAHAKALGIEWRTYRRLATAALGKTPKTPDKPGGHKWSTDGSSGVPSAPPGANSSIPICAPPDLPGKTGESEGEPPAEPPASTARPRPPLASPGLAGLRGGSAEGAAARPKRSQRARGT